MKQRSTRIFLVAGALFLITTMSAIASDRSVSPGAPQFSLSDEAGVNIMTGHRTIAKQDLSIGSGNMLLVHSLLSFDDKLSMFADNFSGSISRNPGNPYEQKYKVSIGLLGETFSNSLNSNVYTSVSGDGGKLAKINSNEWHFTNSSGTVIIFDERINFAYQKPEAPNLSWIEFGAPTKMIMPDGLTYTIHYVSASYQEKIIHRIQSVTSTAGYQLFYEYISNTNSVISSNNILNVFNWRRPVKITALNNATDYCSPISTSCSLSSQWASVTYSWPHPINGGEMVVTYPDGTSTKYLHGKHCRSTEHATPCGNNFLRIVAQIDTTSDTTYTQNFEYRNYFICVAGGDSENDSCTDFRFGLVSKATIRGKEWNYSYNQIGSGYTESIYRSIGPNHTMSVNVANDTKAPSSSINSILGEEAQYYYSGKLKSLKDNFSGSVIEIPSNGYDSRGNILSVVRKPSNSLNGLVSTSSFSTTCINVKTCNKPNYTIDANGARTDYTYHPESGLIAAITLPPNRNGERAQTRYFYTAKYAKYRRSFGSAVNALTPIWVLDKESYCLIGSATTNGCTSSSEEVITTYEYRTTNVANNLELLGIAVTHQGEVRRVCFAYDAFGNKVSETDANANLSNCQ